MSEDQGPWSRLPPPPDSPPARRPALPRGPVIIAVCLLVALGFLWLAKSFAHPLVGEDWWYLAQAVGVTVLCVSALLARRLHFGQVARYTLIWGAIIAVLVVGYTLRDELASVGPRVLSEFNPAHPVATGPRSLTLTRDDDGAYAVMGRVNDQPVRFMVDTGASDIVLSPQDARRLGVDPAALKFDRTYETANGFGRGATYTVASLTVGPIHLGSTEVSINQAPMSQSLLGMAFLKRLDSFEFKGQQLTLRGRP